MAICPSCRGEMKTLDVVCPHCGYDFPPAEPPASAEFRREGIEYSALADVALLISAVAAAAGCLAAMWMTGVALIHWQIVGSLLYLLGFFLQLGMLVVFLRTMRAT